MPNRPVPRTVLVDASTLRSGGGPIIAAHELLQLARALPDTVFHVVHPPDGLPIDTRDPASERLRRVDGPSQDPSSARGFAAWNLWEAARLRERVGADAFVSLTNWLPTGLDVPTLLYMHNPYATRLRLSEWRRMGARLPRFMAAQSALARARVIVTQTEAIGVEVAQALGRLGPLVQGRPLFHRITPDGAWMRDKQADSDFRDRLESRRSEAESWIFYPSVPWAHKNMDRLIDALRRLWIQGKRVGLVLPKGGVNQTRAGDVPLLSFDGLTQAQMAAAYDWSDAVVFPSLLETAGLGLVEALARGRPLIASDRAFVHELCGTAAWVFDPESVDDLARTLASVLDRSDLQVEGRRRAEAWQQAQRTEGLVTWRRAMADLVDDTATGEVLTPDH